MNLIFCSTLNNWCPSCLEGECFCKTGVVPVFCDLTDLRPESH
jgi:hypothetical protein